MDRRISSVFAGRQPCQGDVERGSVIAGVLGLAVVAGGRRVRGLRRHAVAGAGAVGGQRSTRGRPCRCWPRRCGRATPGPWRRSSSGSRPRPMTAPKAVADGRGRRLDRDAGGTADRLPEVRRLRAGVGHGGHGPDPRSVRGRAGAGVLARAPWAGRTTSWPRAWPTPTSSVRVAALARSAGSGAGAGPDRSIAARGGPARRLEGGAARAGGPPPGRPRAEGPGRRRSPASALLPIDAAAAPAVAYLDDPARAPTVRQQVLVSFAGRPDLLTEDAILKRLYDPEPGVAEWPSWSSRRRGLTDEQIGLGRMIFHPKPELRASVIPLLRDRTDIDPVVWLLHSRATATSRSAPSAVEALAGRLSPEVRAAARRDGRGRPVARGPPGRRQARPRSIPRRPPPCPPCPARRGSIRRSPARPTANLNPRAN